MLNIRQPTSSSGTSDRILKGQYSPACRYFSAQAAPRFKCLKDANSKTPAVPAIR
ncbi:hypothetical protein ACTHPF_20860 [Paenibacillus sp. SAF-054]